MAQSSERGPDPAAGLRLRSQQAQLIEALQWRAEVRNRRQAATQVGLVKRDGKRAERFLDLEQLTFAGNAVNDKIRSVFAPRTRVELIASPEHQVRHRVSGLNRALRPGEVASHEDVEA